MSKQKKKKAKVNPDLEGFEVGVNAFGEINSSFDIDKLNDFLNKNVEDKKLIDRDDSPDKQ
ncbi:MAG: hypothetical protein JXQ96_03310 [Cyclobacteriaceae bacterium]